jgi:hypothetical protein
MPASVEYGLELEVRRLRELADKVSPEGLARREDLVS